MSGVRRSRWAAIGAAVAVSLGAGGLGLARASSGVESSFVSVTPARVLDTRAGLGLAGPLVSPTPAVLQVTGSIDRPNGTSAVVVPNGASAVVLNVTVAGPTADGYVSVRPDGTPGAPETSNLNFTAGDIIPNAVTVALPASGKIELTYDAFGGVGPTTDVLVDVTGYYVAASGGGGETGATGPAGPQGATGPQGPKGDTGANGPGYDLAQVVWVAKSGGDFALLSAALASITDNSPSKRYVVRIAPGVYTETGPVAMKNFVDVEGSGQGVTTLTCECGSGLPAVGVVTAENITAEIRHLTINNTGGGERSAAVTTNGVEEGKFSMLHLTANGVGGSDGNYGVDNRNSSSPSMNNVSASATGGTFVAFGVSNENSSSPSMNNVTATATATGGSSFGVSNNFSSSPSMKNVTAIATGGTNSYGVSNNSFSSPSMSNVTATATGGTVSNGVSNTFSSPSMSNVTATAAGGTTSYGVSNTFSSPSMSNVTATAAGGTTSYGVSNTFSSSPSVRGSSLHGTTASVSNSGDSSAKIADTTLTGPVLIGDGLACVGVHNQDFIGFNTTCTALLS